MSETPDADPPLLTVFRNRLRPEAADEYHTTVQRMRELAVAMPGFVESKTFTADDGERVTIVTFADSESQRAWRDHPEHRLAQSAGANRFYQHYTIQVARLEYERRFERGDEPPRP